MAAIDVVDGARSPAPKCRRVIVVDESHEEPYTCKLPRSVASASPSSATTSPNHLSDVTHRLALETLCRSRYQCSHSGYGVGVRACATPPGRPLRRLANLDWSGSRESQSTLRRALAHAAAPAACRLADQAHPGHVAARSVQTCNKAILDWIVSGKEDNRRLRGRRLCHRRRQGIRGDHGHLTTYEVGGHFGEPIVLPLRPTAFGWKLRAFDGAAFV